ncbi:MAG: hypothetical protein J0G32_01105 [Alphaproteobacteria bacterium]|nr:hypothetical protein [Alphaproteobacteria bacterium]OJV13216.1 MAG: hypothetical protein BGO27_00225 [Alphaproteobacteria bacterium 33-17]
MRHQNHNHRHHRHRHHHHHRHHHDNHRRQEVVNAEPEQILPKERHIKKKSLVNHFYIKSSEERLVFNVLTTVLTGCIAVLVAVCTAASLGVAVAGCMGAMFGSFAINRFMGGIVSAYQAKRLNLSEIGRSFKDIIFIGHGLDASDNDLHTYNPAIEKLRFDNVVKDGKTIRHAYIEPLTELEKQRLKAKSCEPSHRRRKPARGTTIIVK